MVSPHSSSQLTIVGEFYKVYAPEGRCLSPVMLAFQEKSRLHAVPWREHYRTMTGPGYWSEWWAEHVVFALLGHYSLSAGIASFIVEPPELTSACLQGFSAVVPGRPMPHLLCAGTLLHARAEITTGSLPLGHTGFHPGPTTPRLCDLRNSA